MTFFIKTTKELLCLVQHLGLHKLYTFVFHTMLLRVKIRKGLSVRL